jgi:hypothetical protein
MLAPMAGALFATGMPGRACRDCPSFSFWPAVLCPASCGVPRDAGEVASPAGRRDSRHSRDIPPDIRVARSRGSFEAVVEGAPALY